MNKVIPINNENISMCQKCGGECCKHKPGLYHPDQILSGSDTTTHDRIKRFHEVLDSGKFIIVDVYDDNEKRHWAIQPRTSLTQGKIAESADGWGVCVNLTNNGCSLNFQERPMECQTLVPDWPNSCHHPIIGDQSVYSYISREWSRYRVVMRIVLDQRWEKYAIKG